jgi:branched-chain amino acid transport system substrate-binding protein
VSLAAALLLSIGGLEAPAADDVIVLGAALSLTGQYALAGTHTRNGYELAVRKVNDKGGVKVGGKSYRLVVRYYDDQSKPSRGGELAERLIRQDGVKFMLGANGSGFTSAMLPVLEKYKVPMIEANAAPRELFSQGYRYIFAVISTSDQYLIPAIDLAGESAAALRKTKDQIKVAIAVEQDAFAQNVRAGIFGAAARHGMRIVIDDRLPADLGDMSATLARVQSMKPDVLVVSGQERGAITAIKQINALQLAVPIVALTHCDSAQLAERLGHAAEHAFCAHQWHRSLGYRDPLFGAAEDFARHFEQTYNYAAPDQAAQSAAAVHVFADAFRRANSLDPETVRGAIAATDLETFFGPIKFDEAGRNVAKSVLMTQIQQGEYVVVAPPEWAKAKPLIAAPPQ